MKVDVKMADTVCNWKNDVEMLVTTVFWSTKE